jgi:hypothetical protein
VEAESPRAQRPARTVRFWRPIAAVAAVLLFAVMWQAHRPAEPVWPIEWAEDVTISELRVHDGVPAVMLAGDEQAITVIWNVDMEG